MAAEIRDPDDIRVLIAEDEPTVREALGELIDGEVALRLVGAAADAEEAIQLAQEHRPDVALLDV
ncbi:MAG TPA: response regulator, partial [Actinomycetota bacterium]|nr:response regulator [Actinomycetota bacterium]